MKKLLLLLSFSLALLLSHAQTTDKNEFSDIIWLKDGSTIKNCNINEVKTGSMVFYTLNGNEEMTEAIALRWNDEYINLKEHIKPVEDTQNEAGTYKGNNYDYYHNLQTKAATQRNIGIGLAAGGLTIYVIGAQMASAAGYNEHTGKFDDEDAAATAGLVIIAGVIMINVGIPLWASGGIKNSNNKKAMAKCKQPDMSLKFGGTKDGLGLVLNF